MTSITFYGGVGEIGGNKLLLEDQDTRVFLDFGMSFGQSGKYFSEFLNPRKCNGLGDYLATGLLPDIEGIYREDYLRHMGREKEDRLVDAFLISHAHIDHMAYIHHVRSDIELVMSHGTKSIIQTLQDTRTSGENDLLEYSPNFEITPYARGDGYKRKTKKDECYDRPCTVFDYGEKYRVGGLEVVPFEVDHSLPGATAFLIHASEGSVLYTGDYRFHGYLGCKTRDMVEAVSAEGVDVVITEGTRIEETASTSEAEVYENAKRLVEQTEGLVVTSFPVRDLSRFRSFHRIAGETGRKLVISFSQAYLLEQFNKHTDLYPPADDPDLCLFAERKSWGIAGRDDYDSNVDGLCFPGNICEQDYSTWEREYLRRDNTINYLDMADQSEYIFICGYFQLNELVDVQPVPGSKYIRSITEPFDDEMKLDAERVKNWLDLFRLELHGMSNEDRLHASGHADGVQVVETLKKLNPKTVIPIHTENPDFLKNHFDNVEKVGYNTTLSL